MRGETFKKESSISISEGFIIFLEANDREESTSMATRNKAILHHLPAPVRLLKTIYFKQMKMHFNVAGSSQLKRVKAEKLLQQKYLSFGFFGSCAFSTSQQSEFPYPLFSLAVGLKEVISLAPSGFFFPFKEILGSLDFHYFHYLYFVYLLSVWLLCSV